MFDVTSNDCLLRSTPLTFDPALIDIFLAIHAGASIAIFSKEIRQNPMKFSSIFDQSQCTIAQVIVHIQHNGSMHCIFDLKDDTEFLSAS